MNAIARGHALEEVAAVVWEALDRARIPVVLSGGAVVSIYSDNAYESFDLDFVRQGLARKVASKSAVTIGCAMEAIERGRHLPLDEAMDVEIEQWRTLVDSEDMREGVRAFLEKRQPQFKDQ